MGRGAQHPGRDRLRRPVQPALAAAAPARWPPCWRPSPSPAPVAVRDGATLRVNVVLPAGGGRFPVLMSAHPYGKDNLPRRRGRGYRVSFQYRVLRPSGPGALFRTDGVGGTRPGLVGGPGLRRGQLRSAPAEPRRVRPACCPIRKARMSMTCTGDQKTRPVCSFPSFPDGRR